MGESVFWSSYSSDYNNTQGRGKNDALGTEAGICVQCVCVITLSVDGSIWVHHILSNPNPVTLCSVSTLTTHSKMKLSADCQGSAFKSNGTPLKTRIFL